MPLLSIVDATSEAILAAGLRRVGLMGAVFKMRERFFRDRLAQTGAEVLAQLPPTS